MESVYGLHDASEINTALDSLPTAQPVKLYYGDEHHEVKGHKGVLVTDRTGYGSIVHCPSNRYQIVQHTEAFRPIIEGMVQAGVEDFKYTMLANHRWAEMNILVSETGMDGVRIGFRVKTEYHYRSFSECMSKMFELDECAASGFQQYLEEIGGV